MEVIGIDRMMFSVDYPFSANTNGRAFLDGLAGVLSSEHLEKLSHRNAERVLKLRDAIAKR
jgi:predicted TIM-barrel fold metal-dependent hydrolase